MPTADIPQTKGAILRYPTICVLRILLFMHLTHVLRKPYLLFLLCVINGSLIAANSNLTTLENGYEYILRRDGLIHVSAWAELRYRGSNGKINMVWPYVMQTESIAITNKVAAFIGRKAIPDDREPKREVLVNRVIAVEAPGPPLDISDQILKLWCMEKGANFPVALKTFNVVSLRRVASGIEVDFIVAIERKPTGITFPFEMERAVRRHE